MEGGTWGWGCPGGAGDVLDLGAGCSKDSVHSHVVSFPILLPIPEPEASPWATSLSGTFQPQPPDSTSWFLDIFLQLKPTSDTPVTLVTFSSALTLTPFLVPLHTYLTPTATHPSTPVS